MKKKVCVVVASRANYARIKYVMKAIQEHPDLELQVIVGASTLLYRFGKAIDVIQSDGFPIDRKIYYVIEGETLSTQAKSTGLGIVELSTAFENLQPDMVVTVADRFETMATAIAATYMNIPLVHIQGGEVSGNIDDRVRHATTKLADFHFTCSEEAKERVLSFGENPDNVYNLGCPAMDILLNQDLSINNKKMARYGGTGKEINWEEQYILMVQHPVTTSYGNGRQEVEETLNALLHFKDIQKVVLWPNIDAGSDDVSKGIRLFKEKYKEEPFHFFRNFSPEDYACVLKNAVCTVGNSSSFIREGAFLGVPAVIVGDRQKNREAGDNIKIVNYSAENIRTAIHAQILTGRYPKSTIFGTGNSGKRIVSKLSEILLRMETLCIK